MFFFLKKQLLFGIVGFCAMIIMSYMNYSYLKRLAFPIYVAANGMLVFVWLFGTVTNGAKRFIYIPGFGQFQPSEIAKVGVILMISLVISSNKTLLKSWFGFFVCSAIVGISAFFVFLGNLSTAIIVSVIGFGMIFCASPYIWRFVLPGAGAVSGLVAYLALSKGNFRSGRFQAWLDPFKDPEKSGYQTIQSLYAIASGGMFGLGIGQSRQKSFIPEAHNDIIFSIICEELGFVGASLVLLLFGILIYRGIRVALNAPDTFSSLVATGVVILIASQVIINVAVVTNSIPNTGVPMPFISAGGTSLIVTMGLVGILLNISRCTKER